MWEYGHCGRAMIYLPGVRHKLAVAGLYIMLLMPFGLLTWVIIGQITRDDYY